MGTFLPGASGPKDKGCVGRLGLGTSVPAAPAPVPPTDVDECAWEPDPCREGRRCVNLLGSYRCLPNCGPGFRAATDGAGCEGDGQGAGLSRLPGTQWLPGFSRGHAVCHWDAGPSGKLELSWQKESSEAGEKA